MSCPRTRRDFHASVNMSPAEIRAWAKDPRSREASWESTRRRLPQLAVLKAKQGAWSESDCRYAQRVLNFNGRMGGMVRKWGCTLKLVVALRNWGRQPPGCPEPR